MHRGFLFLAVIFSLIIFVIPINTKASSQVVNIPEDNVRIFYYRDGPKALASLKKNYRSIDVLAPQSYQIDGAGNLTGEPPKKALSLAKSKKIAVIPLVTNGAFEATSVKTFLESEEARTSAISSMIIEAKKRNYVGWQIDFEQMDVSLKDHFTEFVREAENSFDAENLSLSVAVVAKISDNPEDYPNDLWKKLIGVYDYEALGEASDFVSVMSYDEPYKTGPVSPYPWLKQVLNYTLEKISPEKISLGVPLYYWEREDGGKNRIMEIGGATGVNEAKGKKRAKIGYDKKMETAFVKYNASQTDPRVVWHESKRSIEAKLKLVVDNNLHGVSVWALGLELPETHKAFQTVL